MSTESYTLWTLEVIYVNRVFFALKLQLTFVYSFTLSSYLKRKLRSRKQDVVWNFTVRRQHPPGFLYQPAFANPFPNGWMCLNFQVLWQALICPSVSLLKNWWLFSHLPSSLFRFLLLQLHTTNCIRFHSYIKLLFHNIHVAASPIEPLCIICYYLHKKWKKIIHSYFLTGALTISGRKQKELRMVLAGIEEERVALEQGWKTFPIHPCLWELNLWMCYLVKTN